MSSLNFSVKKRDNGIGRGLRGYVKLVEKKMKTETRAAVRFALELGEEQMKLYIATRGINKPGRIETRHMIESVGHGVRGGGGWGSGEVGWTKGEAEYFTYQEEGFRHYKSGKQIPAMLAFHDMWPQVKDFIRAELRRITG